MVLKRPQICELIQFRSWTGVMFWIMEVGKRPWNVLTQEYLMPFREQGKRAPLNNPEVKQYLIDHADELAGDIKRRTKQIEDGILTVNADMSGCKCYSFYQITCYLNPPSEVLGKRQTHRPTGSTKEHYRHFIVEALAMDVYAAARPPLKTKHYLSKKAWARDGNEKSMEIMYEFTEAFCHNFWRVSLTHQFSDSHTRSILPRQSVIV
ncbi:hypothetical protein VTJ49DRAFT_6070 [Mycothermus thermophilus]|uniref:Uncharacterized protein n=1 Tax=Humicola insolens TaxID=85995 RepID=A0ABR3VL33_HUMIN